MSDVYRIEGTKIEPDFSPISVGWEQYVEKFSYHLPNLKVEKFSQQVFCFFTSVLEVFIYDYMVEL